MFAEKFENLIDKYPREADAFGRLANFFRKAEVEQGERYKKLKLDPNRLFEISQAGSNARLARVVSLLLDEGVLSRLLIVESPTGGGIGNFRSYDEIPDVIHDLNTDLDMEVTMDQIKTIYIPNV